MPGNATERWSPRTSSKSAGDTQGREREFDVVVTDSGDEDAVFGATLTRTDYPNPTGKVPVIDEPHPLNSRLKVNALRISWPGMKLARLHASYAIPPAGTFGSEEEDPVNRKTKWRWNRSVITEPVDRDRDDNPIVNSARDPFVGVTRRFTQRIVEAVRYEYFYDEALAAMIENKVNSAAWSVAGVFSIAAGMARCNIVSPVDEYEADAPYIRILYQFEIRWDGWRTRNLDQGAWAYGPAGKKFRICDANGEPVSSALLDGSGVPVDTNLKLANASGTVTPTAVPLPPGADLDVNDDLTAGYLRYALDEEFDFNVLAF